MNHDTKPSFSMARRWTLSLNVLLSILAVVALVAMVNYLAARHFHRIPISQLARMELSGQTRRILQSVTNNVKVTIYYDRTDGLYEMVNGLLKEYKFANGRIGVETVDYVKDPAAAQRVKAQYQLASQQKNVVIFECHGNKKVVYEKELSDLDLEPLISGKSTEVRRSAFKGELLFTSAIYSVTSPRALKGYFLKGHGEHSPQSSDKDSGYSRFAGLLTDNNVDWDTLSLIGTNQIPADCSVLIIAGPQTSMTPEELAKIEGYLNNGGRTLVLFNVLGTDRNTGLEGLLVNWGVDVRKAVVSDRLNSSSGQDLITEYFGTHPISAPLIGSSLHMVYPRAMGKASRGSHRTDAPNVSELVSTSPQAAIVTDFRGGFPNPSPTDVKTNVTIAVAIEKGKLQGLPADRGTTRAVVVGDSFFWNNNMIDSAGNRDFASLTVNWLLDRSQLLGSLAPRPIPQFRVVMTERQMTAVRWLLLFGMPGSVLLLGSMVWVQRRH
jgi:ABC-2 type transport system permease protein